MRYAGYDDYETVNGNGGGMSIYVQGCHEPHCYNCFNPETWDFNGGKEWTEEIENKFLELANRPYIKRISLLGGECLAEENLDGVLNLVNKLRLLYGNTKTIWIYSGFYWQEIFEPTFTDQSDEWIENYLKQCEKRKKIISQCDVLVDGRYVDSLRNPALPYRGSENQSLIDIQKSIQKGEVILWEV
jgi:anaerobic ribonucleoside-triphosphate reductase activating protein